MADEQAPPAAESTPQVTAPSLTTAQKVVALVNKLKAAEAAGAIWFNELIALVKQDGPQAEAILQELITVGQNVPPWMQPYTASEVVLAIRFLQIIQGFLTLV